MQILSVELENVKSYEYAKVEFTPGVNAIVGHNGAGKSTLLEAIGYVLFDSLEYSQAEFVRGGAKQGTARVNFISSADERAYEVVRRVGSGSQYYVFDPSLDAKVCEGKADVLRFLREHLGVPAGANLPALFKDAVGVPQGTLTAAFLASAAERKSLFERLLQVREYTEAVEKLREPVHLLKQRQSAIAAEIAGLEGRMERLPALQAEVAGRVAVLQETEQALTGAGVELVKIQEQFSRSEAARVALEALERKVDQACQKLKSDQDRVTLARQALADAEEASRIVAANEAGYRRYQAVQAEQARLDEQARRRAELMGERSAADKAVALASSQAEQLAQELAGIAVAEAAVIELAAAVDEQAKLEQALAEARQQQARLEDAKRLAAQLADQVDRLQKRLATLDEQLARKAQIDEERRAVEDRIAEYSAALEQARAVMNDYKTRGELLKEQTTKLENIQTAVCPLCEQPLTDGHRGELLARNQEQLRALRQSYSETQRLFKEQETRLQEQQAAARRLQEELLQLPRLGELDTLRQEVASAQEAHAQAQRQGAELAAAP
ncbi:MAG TPA: SMC family ATPase, partial [Caldilineaceae bacterium]|nr:SMC family ATPase [Caldilineaceae bacterium]